ncbi:MAG: hypothetical protein A2Y10_14825 [Planctomycetes bacterium GWF2_41_51]|nr:MAG: hypothetical protein A2Y10_14825 [Planctomycetes bacterium GWF2_41_51]HBG28983.1 hypothetical protein [Phycisphaerales bacterium]
MQEQIQQKDHLTIHITRTAMETELGDDYKRCWAYAFKYATEELDFDEQVENLCREFDLIKSQAQWFVKGANSILFKKEAKEIRQTNQENYSSNKNKQCELADFSQAKTKPSEKYVSQLEMMSFLEDIEEMCNDADFSEFWEELGKIKQKVIEQYCATDKEVLAIFKIRTMVDRAKQENERFFDAYPISTDAWENGHFDIAGEITFN